ncbi:glycosyltransferase [Sorangium cellulosum]|uniref:CgeB family protein n=1 Tax=Sorangium cellulosum TaxID=56 RepID=UPI003D9A1BB2
MRLVIFGLTISSSWGNGHATLWRGVISALGRAGHRVTFFERDVPYYAAHRDLFSLSHGNELRLYASFEDVLPDARRAVAEADAAMVTSYCPDGGPATELVLESRALKVFYDLDTPVTLDRIDAGQSVGYIGPRGLVDFDCVLSYTGGEALAQLQAKLGARRVFPLYGSADPEVHRPVAPREEFRGDLSYLGTYAADRQEALSTLFLEAARRLPDRRFVIGGSLYPENFPWAPNIYYMRHVAPPDHPAFYCSSPLTLNVTRGAMAAMGYCPSGRLFEAAACGTPILSDSWEGLDRFFTPGKEILVATTTDEAVAALSLPAGEVAAIARAARERVLAEHSAARRAEELVAILESVDSDDSVAAR